MDADFGSFGGDEDLSHFRTGEVTDDVPVLEVMAEGLVELEGDNIQEAVVIPTVDGGSDGVEVQLLRHLECLGGNRNLPYVDLDSEARISGYALGRFPEAPADETSSARSHTRLGETSRNTRLDVRAEVFAYNVFVPARAVPYRPLRGRR